MGVGHETYARVFISLRLDRRGLSRVLGASVLRGMGVDMTMPSQAFFLGQAAVNEFTPEQLGVILQRGYLWESERKAIADRAFDLRQDEEARQEREREQERAYMGPSKYAVGG